jgi:outer membrane receptor for ferrienterochelin and colicin
VINGGLRADELHVILGDGTTRDNTGVSPRLGTSFQASKDVVLHAFSGINWQPPVPTDATAAARALGITPTAYDLKPETDLYAEAGAGWRIWKALKAGLTGWGRYAWNQLDDTAVGSTSLLSNYNFSRGRAVGIEANLDFRLSSWLTAFANGSFEIAEGRGISSAKYLFTPAQIANDAWQTLDHAQTWTANAGATIHDKRFTLSALTAYGSGLRTGGDNTSHVPGHLREDLTMQYTFTPNGFPVRVGADVVNLFDDHYAYRIANGFVGSSYAAPRTVYVSLSIPLSKEGHTESVAVPPPSE